MRSLIIKLLFLIGFTPPGHGQETLKELESRAAELKSRGDVGGSLAALRRAAALDPRSARIEDEIGFLLAVQGGRDEAVHHFERALELDPQFAPAHYHLGVAYWLRQEPARSIPHLEMAV